MSLTDPRCPSASHDNVCARIPPVPPERDFNCPTSSTENDSTPLEAPARDTPCGICGCGADAVGKLDVNVVAAIAYFG